jgi:hypothetical protein
MDYEELYQTLQPLEKELKDKLAAAGRNLKSISKNSEKGDLKALSKDLSQTGSFIKDYGLLLERYTQTTEDFDANGYMTSGEFAKQMAGYCEDLSVDIKGASPVYEMFPYKVKIDAENCELYVDRKKVQCVRPKYFVKSIKEAQEKLNKATFNVTAFLTELSQAYDTLCACKAKPGEPAKQEPDLLLKEIYEYMVPMQRFRREYDAQSYAFDLARLYASDSETTSKDGRSYQFGPSRAAGKLIRILDKDGKEQYLATIRFYRR